MRFTKSAVVAVAMMMSGAAVAQDHPALEALTKACGADIKQFCGDVQPGGGRIMKCLRDNEDKLSQPCKDFRSAARAKIERKSSPMN